MSGHRERITIEAVRPGEDGNTGHKWMAMADLDGSPAYDGSGVTIEEALVRLAEQMAEALLEKSA